jgi:hypothetical protein
MVEATNGQPGADARGPLYAAMTEFFIEDGWPVAEVANQSIVSLNFQGQHGRWMCYGQTREDHQQFVFYSVCPVVVPEARRAAMAEFVTRANFGLIIGNFELDYADGELRYKTSIDVEGTEINQALIRQCVYANVLMMDQYLPGILSLVYSDTEPTAALALVEN